mgnify:CR=1 FL=1
MGLNQTNTHTITQHNKTQTQNQTKYTNAEIAAMKSSGKGFSVDGGSINFGDDGSVTVTHGQTEEGEMIPGIKKDCEDDFQTALLKARGII